MDGQREARKREPADGQVEKSEKRSTFKILTVPRTILFYKNYKSAEQRECLSRV